MRAPTWDLFQRRLETLTRQGRLRADDPATSLTREFWVERLLETLGYWLSSMRSAAVIQSRTYFISHRAGRDEGAPPIRVEGIRSRLDQRPPSGLTRNELRYILGLADVYGPDFPGESFRVLREKEIKQFGEYRPRRLVLEAWDREEGKR